MRKSAVIILAAALLLSTATVHAQEPQVPILIDDEIQQKQSSPVLKDVQTITGGEQRQIIKLYDLPPNYDFTLLESGFDKNGYRYRLGDMLYVSDNYDKQTRFESQMVTVSHEKKEGASGQFSPLLDYEGDGFAGQLKLDTASINTQSAGSKNYSYTVTDTREFTGLERSDSYYVPKTAEKNGVSLSLKDIQWTNMGSGGYRATAQYSGTGTSSRVTGYISTGTYIGEVTKSTLESVTYKMIYEGSAIPPISPSLVPYVLCGIGVIILIGIAILLFIYRKNVKIYGLLNGRYRVVRRKRISYVDPAIDLTAVGLHVTCEEYIIAIDRLAVQNLHGQFVRILCEDGSIINRRIVNDGNACKLHVCVSSKEEDECED